MVLRTAGSVLVVFLWSVTVVLGQDDWSVSYTTQSICTFKESTVELSSSYTYPSGYTVTTTFWFTKYNAEGPVSLSDDPDYKGRVTYSKNKENGHTLTITDLRESDSARYKFRFTDQTGKWRYTGEPGVALSVTGLQVKLTVGFWYNTLTCSTTCTLPDNPTYIWYKNGHKEKEDTSSSYPDSFSDVDSYSCAVKGHEDLLSPAVCQKCWSVTYTQQSICTLKGSTVDISCSYTYPSDHEIKKAFWFTKWSDKDAEDLSSAPGYEGHIEYLGDKESDCTLRITDLRLSDSAGYRFRFITTRDKFAGSPVSLTVTVLQVKMRTSRFSSWVTLTCSTTCTLTDSPTYIWYRNGHKVKEDTSSQYSDYLRNADSYSCAVKGHDNLHSPAVCVRGQNCWSVTYPHQGVCALKGSTVDISSTYDSGDATITSSHWFSSKQSSSWKDELVPEDLTTDPGYAGRVEYVGEKESGRSTLRITDLREEDSAEYKFIFNTQTSGWGYSFPGTTLTVTGLLVKVTPATVTEGQKVTLTCSTTCTLGDNPTYVWYKNGHVTTKSTSLFLNPVSSEDAGRYSCSVEGHEDLPSAEETLTVTYGPKNTSVSVSPSGEIVEGSSVTLTCSSDANPPVDKYTWYKKNVTSPRASGQSYSITNIISEDRGEYYCEAQNRKGSMNSTSLMIIVAGKPTSFVTAAVGIIVVVLVLILCLSGFMWFRKKASKSTSDTRDTSENVQGDSSPVYDNISSMAMTSTAAQTADTDNQDDVHYASVHFSGSKNQEVSLYSTVQLPQPQIQDEDVQYAAVKFSRPSAATR
ncbi:sialoadhesin-like isoform X1 [Oncorhynchus mykiss]|uniref:sialoadhesin-like isoform X1 n=1 Tax=Oncorhynchus mykiss TaxID=8022 RepID=UPI0018784349|nr:sialoadhesin-like isoform X1 [Oncorhynchus mykiss]XP_036796013.1 sialoadhesin-like isoform X1 [Oncorhynchus mykiss]